jgi:hypothetical protein
MYQKQIPSCFLIVIQFSVIIGSHLDIQTTGSFKKSSTLKIQMIDLRKYVGAERFIEIKVMT